MVDIVNAYAEKYDQVILFTGFLNTRKEPLNKSVKVHHLKAYNRNGTINRLFTWGVFFIQSLFLLLFRYPKADLFLVSNPPLNILLGKWLNRKTSFLIYDVYPDALVATGLVKPTNWIVSNWRKWNLRSFQKANQIFTIGQGMKQLLSQYASEEKIEIVPIWSDNNFIKPIPKTENPLVTSWGVEDKFVVMYSGNIGLTHPVEKLLEIANVTQDLPIEYIIIGEGEKKEELVQLKASNNLKNVQLLPYQPTDMLPYSLTVADLAVVTLSDDAGQLSVPSKTFGIMSAGVPILAIAPQDSELNQLISKYEVGRIFNSNKIDEMATYVIDMMSNDERYRFYAKNSLDASLVFTPENAKMFVEHV